MNGGSGARTEPETSGKQYQLRVDLSVANARRLALFTPQRRNNHTHKLKISTCNWEKKTVNKRAVCRLCFPSSWTPLFSQVAFYVGIKCKKKWLGVGWSGLVGVAGGGCLASFRQASRWLYTPPPLSK